MLSRTSLARLCSTARASLALCCRSCLARDLVSSVVLEMLSNARASRWLHVVVNRCAKCAWLRSLAWAPVRAAQAAPAARAVLAAVELAAELLLLSRPCR